MLLVAESAGAGTVRVCVAESVDPATRDQLHIALRKTGVEPISDCERPELRIDARGGGLTLRLRGEELSLGADDASAVTRAAQWVHDASPASGRPRTPLGGVIEIRRPVEPPDTGWHPRGLASLGAAWTFESGTRSHLGSLQARAGVELLRGALQIYCGGGWTPAHSGERGDFSWSRDAGEVLAGIGGGLWVGPVRLSLSAEGGWQWRTADISVATRRSTLSLDSDSGFAGGELEAAFEPWEHVRLALAVAGRGYFGGTEYAWGSEPVLEAPGGAVLLSLRAWAVFP